MARQRKEMPKPWETTTRFLVIIGLLLVIIGGIVYEVQDDWNEASIGLLIAGALVTVVCLAVNARWVLGIFVQKKALLNLNVVVMVALGLAIVGGVNYFSERHYKRFDATEASRYGLSGQTKNQLEHLDRKVRVYTFFTENAALYQDFRFVALAKDTLDEYQASTSKLEVRHLNVMKDLKEIEAIRDELELDSVEANSVIFASGEAPKIQKKVVKTFDMVHTDYGDYRSGESQQSKKFKGEEAFTSAIMTVIDDKPAKVYFVRGHGERRIDDYGEYGYSRLKDELKKSNLEVEELDLSATGRVPDDCAVLAIAGPQGGIPAEHLKAISSYLRRQEIKGQDRQAPALLALLDPTRPPKTRPSGLAALLRSYNIEALEDARIIGMQKVPTLGERGFELKEVPSTSQSVAEYPKHEMTEFLAGQPANFTDISCVRAVTEGASSDYTASVILLGSDKTWGETNFRKIVTQRVAAYDEGEDVAGPVPFGVAVDSKKDGGPRLVVIGDSDFAGKALLHSGQGNLGLAVNSVLWLARKTQRLGLQPVDPEYAGIQITPKGKKTVRLAAQWGLPAAWIVFALGVWVLRMITTTVASERLGVALRFGALLGLVLLVLGGIGYAGDVAASLSITLAVVGLVLFLAGAGLNLDWIRETMKERKTWYGANLVTMAVMALLVLGFANYISNSNYDRLDQTEKQLYALSERSIKELAKIGRPLQATLVLPPAQGLIIEHMEDTLDEFHRHSPYIGLNKLVNTEEQREQILLLSEQLNIKFDGEALPFTLLHREGNVKQVTAEDVIQYEPMNPMMMQMRMRPPPPKLVGERALLDAVLTVATDDKVTLYFSVGNGERHPEKYEDTDLGELAKLLKRANFAVRTTNLEEEATIPSDCDILVLAAPKETYSDAALGIVREHLENEGSLLVFAEPEFVTGTTSGLEELLMDYNIRLEERTVVVDMASKLVGFNRNMQPMVRTQPDTKVEVDDFGYHRVTKDLEGNATLFYMSCSVEVIEDPSQQQRNPYGMNQGGPPPSKWTSAALVKSKSEDGWVDRDIQHGEKSIRFDEAMDTKGKGTIAVAVEPNNAPKSPPNPYMPPQPQQDEKRKGPNLVVFGDADFASNYLIRQVAGNEKLLMSVVRWLGKAEPREFDDIPPKEIDIRPITPDTKLVRASLYVSLFGLPAFCLLFALGIWILRRR